MFLDESVLRNIKTVSILIIIFIFIRGLSNIRFVTYEDDL